MDRDWCPSKTSLAFQGPSNMLAVIRVLIGEIASDSTEKHGRLVSPRNLSIEEKRRHNEVPFLAPTSNAVGTATLVNQRISVWLGLFIDVIQDQILSRSSVRVFGIQTMSGWNEAPSA
jgi:hypothetical protein